ncbi:MAG: deoxynucleotide monophosphate kinase [Pseudomonadota bacterium]
MEDRLIVGLAGRIGSGKTTAAVHLAVQHGFTRHRFAAPLKNMMRCLGLSEDQVDGDRKETPCFLLGDKSPRYAMQTIGTEWGRDMIHPDLWIRAWRETMPASARIVVEDVRFENEAAAIRRSGGLLIRIGRDAVVRSDHQSEFQDFAVDAFVENNGSHPDLYRVVVDAIQEHRGVLL